jgi:hypothetical protein
MGLIRVGQLALCSVGRLSGDRFFEVAVVRLSLVERRLRKVVT